MRKNLLALLISLALINKNAYANLARHDIDWNEYEDFALNIGRYEAGRKGIIVYKKDGSESGIIEASMPSFYGVSDSGNGTLYADPQIIATVAHVGNKVGHSQVQRFMRSDVELSNGFKKKPTWNKLLEYSEDYLPYEHKIPRKNLDHKLIRLRSVMFDFTPFEPIPENERSHLGKVGDLLARVGNGAPKIAIGRNQEIAAPRWGLSGGLNRVKWAGTYEPGLAIESNPLTPIDSGTKGGDSGSPVFIWSEKSQKWYLFATNAAGLDSGYGKKSYLTRDLDGLHKILREYNKEIDTQGDATLSADSNKKNLVYKKDVKLKIDQDTDLGPARLIFKGNSTIEGNGKLTTAGVEVDEGKTLTFKSKIGEKTIIRKVGKGSLKLEGNQNNNKGSIHLGDGTLEIDANSSIGKIKIGSGRATIKVTKDKQFDGNQIYFGIQGGTLDLNGHSLEFDDIFHLDKGAKIVNQPLSKTTASNNSTDSNSTASTDGTAANTSTTPTSSSSDSSTTNESSTSATTTTTTSEPTGTTDTSKIPTFTFKPKGDRVFLGSFDGNLNVNYDANHLWELRGNSSIKDLNIKQGTVKLVGDNVLHTQFLTPSETEYHTITFKADNIKVDSEAKLILGRASKTNANIEINGNLEVVATGKVDTSIPKAYKDEPNNYQQDSNKILVEGKITLNNSNSNNKVLINLENNNTAEIKSEISGNNISLQKKGDGELLLSGNNTFTNGKFDIEKGIVRITDKESAKKLSYTVTNGSTLEIQGIETGELTELLNKFNTDFNGILSLDKDITKLDSKLGEFNHLYLGTKGNITLGTKDENLLQNLSFLNLGGDGGTITVQGLENTETNSNSNTKILNIGNGTYRGKVIIDKLTDKSHLDLNVHTGVDLEIKENTSTAKFLDLGYASTAKVDLLKNLKENSEGVVLINGTDNLTKLTEPEYSKLNKIYIGASKGTTLDITNSTISGDTYRFSGEGNTNLKFDLASDKNLIVDAQGLTGGVISLDNDNTNYKGKITIQGHKDQNLGSISLKASTDNSLGKGNEVVIKNGGILDVNGKSINIKLSTESNQSGTIFSATKGNVTLANTENTEIKNKISGKLDIIYHGNGELSLSNTQNNFTGDINLDNGTLKYSTEGVTNQNNKINISNNAKIDITKNVNSEIVASNNNGASILFTGLNTNNSVSINKLTLNSDVTSKGNNNGSNFDRKKEINYKNLNLNNHTLTAEEQFLSISSVSNKGNLVLNNSTLKLHGGNHTLLSTKNFDKIELDSSTLDLRDYNFKSSETAQKIVIKGDSTISAGTYGSDGGGASSTFNNPLEVTAGSKLNIMQSNVRRPWVNLQIDSDVEGSGEIIASQAGSGNLKITNNFKKFTGSLKLVNKGRTPDLKYYLNSEKEEDRTLNFKILSEPYSDRRPSVILRNIAPKDLILKNVNDYAGTLVADQGNIILDSSNAVSTKAALQEANNNQIIFKVDENVTANAGGFHYYRSGKSNNDGLHKKGKGELIFIDSYTAEKSPKLYIDEGTVTIATKSDFKTKDDVSRNTSAETALTFHTNKDANLNFKVNGEYTVNNTISGDGNVSFNQADDSTKYTTNYSKLSHSGDLTINAKVDLNLDSNDQNSITLRHHLKGNNQGHLTIKGENKTFSIDKNLNDYAGALEISDKTKLDLNLNDATLDNALYGSGTITNQNSSNLNLNNTANFTGTLNAQAGNISINNQFNTNNTGTIQLKSENDHYINITTTDNNSATKFNFIEGNLRKKGLGTLVVNDNVSVDNIKHLDLDEGNLQLNHDINVEELKLGANTKLTLNNTSGNIDHNITGTGNVELKATNTLTNDKLQHTGNLIVNADSTLLINTKDTLSYNLTGNHKLTINSNNEKYDTVLKLNNDNIQHFTGGLAINNTTELNNITNLDNQLSGNGTIINKNSSNLNLNNTADFIGTLNAKEGDISINNQPNANGTIKLKSENGHYINFTTTDNNSSAKFDFTGGNFRKRGKRSLIVDNNVTLNNVDNFVLSEGNVQLDHSVQAQNIDLGANTKLILNTNDNINSNITGTGDVELKAANTLANNKLNHTGDLIVNADTNLTISGSENLAYHLKGKNTVTFSGENSTVQLHGSHINDFSGTLAINNTAELYDVGNSLTNVEGSGTIVSKSGEFSFNNTQFTGEIVADNANIKVIDAGAKKYTAKNADITLPYHLAKDNHSSSFSAINGAFVKADEQQWVLNRENLDKLGKLKIQSGEVIISDLLPSEKDKENENNSNSMLTVPAEFIADNTPRPHPRSLHRKGRSLLSATIPAAITVSDDTILPANEKEVEIKQGAKLILDTNHQVDKIKNEGTVNLNTHTLSIDDYSSEHGKIIIALNDKTNQVLNIKKTDKNVDVELVATKDTLTYLASNGIKIANLPTQLNILNEEQLTKGNYDLTNVNGMIKLLLAPNLMSKILRLTEIHQLNQLHTNEPFIEGVTVKANYSNGKIKEKFLKDYRNTLFKSQANTSGITINLGKTYGRLTGKLTLKALNTDFQSEVNHKTQQDKLKTLAAETGIKVEYKPGYGATLSAGILQSSFKQGKYALLNGNLSLYANPRYPLGKGVLTLENELSVRYTPILSQALPADEMAKLTNPFAYAYRLGLNYQYQKFDFNLATKVTFDNTQLTYIRKEALVNSDLIKGLSYQLSAGVKYHFTKKLNLSLTSDTTFSKNSTQFGAKIGVTYNF
ncbi:hypothetical protein CEP45_06480 [Mergibacter septicus]|uniref:S6 family peptidase n=1 Tax=Mergibacter septicus TaxID=221402 RepID=UPI001C760B2D|nr:S6 family peptidase [Mergibacter septicus]QDJ13514.1 hypothetical protein CEP45_06480 [Mergibacter septicus]